MDALDINYHLRRQGKTKSQIARELGVHQGVVSKGPPDRLYSQKSRRAAETGQSGPSRSLHPIGF
jgi:hypothetical protein